MMSRMVKDYVAIGDHASLDNLIEQLTRLRDTLSPGAEAELRVRSDVFGRHLAVGFMRPLTEEEASCEGRYAEGAPKLKRAA